MPDDSATRLAAVAGQFYPSDAAELARAVDSYLVRPEAALRCRACIVPHAGYAYAGHVAGAVYGSIAVPGLCIVLGPNHRGLGEPLAFAAAGEWATPLGNVPIARELAAALLAAFPALRDDPAAHDVEHSIEVQLPFLQRRNPGLQFVPVCIATHDFGLLEQLGAAIAQAVQLSRHDVLLVASTDMNHYEDDRTTRQKDAAAIAPMLALDGAGLRAAVERNRISMCGYAPVIATLAACRALSASPGHLVRYATSAEVSGDRSFCVGYAGALFP